jgi:hypothetical protein
MILTVPIGLRLTASLRPQELNACAVVADGEHKYSIVFK